MKSNHSELNNRGINDPCCDELLVWNKLKIRIRESARWILWLLALILIILLTLGYFLDPSIIRILWLVISAALLIVVLPLVTFLGRWIKQCSEECESE
jgi:hypothetical protein